MLIGAERAQNIEEASFPAEEVASGRMGDDQDILGLYRILLDDWGLQVYTANSVTQAKELMKRHRCPVVVVDMHLTDGDGLELMRHFWLEQPEIKGIIISGSAIVGFASETVTSGIQAFLQKPIDLNVLGTELVAAFSGVASDHVV